MTKIAEIHRANLIKLCMDGPTPQLRQYLEKMLLNSVSAEPHRADWRNKVKVRFLDGSWLKLWLPDPGSLVERLCSFGIELNVGQDKYDHPVRHLGYLVKQYGDELCRRENPTQSHPGQVWSGPALKTGIAGIVDAFC
jgi:hypothetical protein